MNHLAAVALALARQPNDFAPLTQWGGLEWFTSAGAVFGLVGVVWLRVRR